MDYGHGEAGLVLYFEELHTVIGDNGRTRLMVLESHQRTVLREMTRRNEDGSFVYRYWIYSCPKKSGKSEIGGGLGVWAGITMGAYNEVYFAANSKYQATTRAFAAASRAFKENLLLRQKYKVRTFKNEISLEQNSTKIVAASSDAGSMAGANPGMVIWDELWAFTTSEDGLLWSELAPSPARRDSVTVVVTYAGFENDSKLLWDLYLKGVGPEEHKDGKGTRKWVDLPVYTNGPIFCYWDHEPRMPWHTKAWLEDERLRCPGTSTWLRHYENRWASSTNALVTEELWAGREIPELRPLMPHSPLEVSVAVDLAYKHDTAAVMAVYYYRDEKSDKIRLATHMIWYPPEGAELDIEETVEAFILGLFRDYQLKGVWYDPFQMVRSAQALTKKGVPMLEFPQTENNLTLATNALYRAIRFGQLECYLAPDLREHVLNAVTVEGPRGIRLKKDRQDKKIDGAVALAAAIYGLETELDGGAGFSCGVLST